MKSFLEVLSSYTKHPIAILDNAIPLENYKPLDLSVSNIDLKAIDITDPIACEQYINDLLEGSHGNVAYGGYLEQRNLYADKAGFSGSPDAKRNIHLGVDYWCAAGTKVIVPISGTVHSFKNNNTSGDYGPTIILAHKLKGYRFYTLYGHLSVESLDGLEIGKQFDAGTVLGTLGTADINVNYAPHLHFQLVQDIGGYFGDYPGVCALTDLEYYKKNCPDPNLLLNIG
ncbi:peptidoglycan DD-metalloendopeptidase family protein [Maribacter chungangensis]|uniref:Peptidoglycan DD-metalloendopeptidase family protein n=1 Tax=Maribacter chungangensis TaxID=1069117 RepID=A0ABW3B215_9FLAO